MPRTDHRLRVRREATLILDGYKMSCQICDSSRSGAKLAVPYTQWLPPEFVLEDSGVRRQVALVWQGSEHIGVRYLDELPRKKAPVFGRRGR